MARVDVDMYMSDACDCCLCYPRNAILKGKLPRSHTDRLLTTQVSADPQALRIATGCGQHKDFLLP